MRLFTVYQRQFLNDHLAEIFIQVVAGIVVVKLFGLSNALFALITQNAVQPLAMGINSIRECLRIQSLLNRPDLTKERVFYRWGVWKERKKVSFQGLKPWTWFTKTDELEHFITANIMPPDQRRPST